VVGNKALCKERGDARWGKKNEAPRKLIAPVGNGANALKKSGGGKVKSRNSEGSKILLYLKAEKSKSWGERSVQFSNQGNLNEEKRSWVLVKPETQRPWLEYGNLSVRGGEQGERKGG